MDTKRSWLTEALSAFNAHYPTFLEGIIGLGDIVQTLTQTVIVAFGSLFVLVLLVIVEYERVMHGIVLFEANEQSARFAALALVCINLVVEFQIVHIDFKAGYKERRMRKSLRLWAVDMAYRVGAGNKWKAQALPESHVYRQLSGWITRTILVLAVAGSMRAMIQQQSGTWYDAAINIVTDSTLNDMVIWVGGFFFAATAVFGAQGISYYTGVRVIEIKRQMQYRKQSAQRVKRAETRLAVISPPPVWGEHRRVDLQPIKVKLQGGRTAYKCPNCGKQMSRQAWAKHPCRLTDVDGSVDVSNLSLTVNDSVDNTVDRQLVNPDVNSVN